MSTKQIRRISKREAKKLFSSNKLKSKEYESVREETLSSGNMINVEMNSNSTENIFIKNEKEVEHMCISDPLQNPMQSLLMELTDEIKSLRSEIRELKQEVQKNKKTMTKLMEEVKAVKLENRKYNATSSIQTKEFKKLPFHKKEDFQKFDDELQKNEELLDYFKQYIAKTGGDGPSQFIRAAVRKVFADELASAYSWKGTLEKPSAEKAFVIQIIKNICHLNYQIEERRMNVVLQRHFVHAKERITKRKRPI